METPPEQAQHPEPGPMVPMTDLVEFVNSEVEEVGKAEAELARISQRHPEMATDAAFNFRLGEVSAKKDLLRGFGAFLLMRGESIEDELARLSQPPQDNQ